MTAIGEWTGVEPLPLGRTILLEASAGTGKTWQIEGLVVRLVAEYEVPIDRILVITFTNAATAELRDRVRRRLVEARDAMDRPVQPLNDPILSWLWADEPKRTSRRTSLATALSSFDLAPISTIHGFSQRMLDQLAFESGQEPGLELLTDSGPILKQMVDDELARVFTEATEKELVILTDMGWRRAPLHNLARKMTKAVEPILEPDFPGVDIGRIAPLQAVRDWLKATTATREWLDSTDGAACVEAVRSELDRKKGKRLKRMRRDVTGKWLDGVKAWLEGPAVRSDRGARSGLPTWLKNLGLGGLEKAWTDGPDEMVHFEGYGLFKRVSALLEEQDRLWPRALLSFAARARAHLNEELVRSGQLTYSTMLSRLADRIAEQAAADGQEGLLAGAIRSRYDVALVDEFQDTDGAQWPVMQAVFAHPERRLLIIGDPKQAIYAFRGADVHVYLDAARVAHTRATMRTNWRSDADYIRAMNHVWAERSGAFDLPDVDYVEVGSSPAHKAPRIRGLPDRVGNPTRAFELRWVDGECLALGSLLVSRKGDGQGATARLAALEVARLLEANTEISTASEAESDAQWRALQPGDIAVLVRTNEQAERMRQQLTQLGIPSVSAGRGSVLESPVLRWLCAWLDAVADPGRDRPARALVTTPLFGWTASDLASVIAAVDAASDAVLTDDEEEAAHRWEYWLQSIQTWALRWQRHGFVRVFEGALNRFGVVRRLLGAQQGERYATDLRHLVELCHTEQQRTRVGPSALASWLRAALEAVGDGADEAQALRLESDARAVQLVTIHKSKGLEYPVVLLPFGWADFQPSDKGGALDYHATVDDRTEIRLNLEPVGTDNRSRVAELAGRELRQEQLRLLYVALTRARHHCVAWLGPFGSAGRETDSYALGRVVLRDRDADGSPLEDGTFLEFQKGDSEKAAAQQRETRDKVHARLELLASTSDGVVGWSIEPPIEPREPLSLEPGSVGRLEARPWPKDRPLITPWQVSSYSAMVAGRTFDASEPQRLDEMRSTRVDPDDSDVTDDLSDEVGAQVDLGEPVDLDTGLDVPIASTELRGGRDVGTWAHAVLEHLDFQNGAGRDGRDLHTLIAELGVRHGVRSAQEHELLEAMIPAVLDTPLCGGRTGLPEDFSLRGLGAADRLDELGFDLKLGEGSRWQFQAEETSGLLNHDGARVALESRLDDAEWGGDGWLNAVLNRAAQEKGGVLPPIAGILTGFIDLVFRVEVPTSGSGTQHRYFVSDYKTNRIAPPNRRRTSHRLHYTRPWMDWEMGHHGYHLQALLYTVALHRMLRQRLEDYTYERHIGGHLYLFLRGMGGPDTPRDRGLPLGVFFDRWPASVVLGLDAALLGAGTDQVRAIVDGARGGVR